MTEEEWLTSNNIHDLLHAAFPRRTGSKRKMRLLSCAFARSVLHLAADSRAAGLLSVAEECIEVHDADLKRSNTRREMSGWYRDILPKSSCFAVSAIYYALSSGTTLDCHQVESVASRATDSSSGGKLFRCHLLRCIVGNPFRPVAFAPTWRTETVIALASGIYADRAFDRLPILADALEEAGCDHVDILAHCRGTGPHARGCRVVDGVLGRS